MSSVWYMGRSSSYTITSQQWSSVGAPGSDVTWNMLNGFSIPMSNFTSQQLIVLGNMTASFALNQPDGPRVGSGNTGGTGDKIPPSAPGAITAVATSPTQVIIAWTAATDNIGVSYYRVRRDGVEIGTTPGLTYTDDAAPSGSSPVYSIAAVDAAANVGIPSSSAPIPVPAVSNLSNTTPLYIWSAGKQWNVGQVVLYAQTLYQVNEDHISTSTFDATKFDALTAQGGSGGGTDGAPKPTAAGLLRWDTTLNGGSGGYVYVDQSTLATKPAPSVTSILAWDKNAGTWAYYDPASFLGTPSPSALRILAWDPISHAYNYIDPATIPSKPTAGGLLQWDPTLNSGAGGYIYVDPTTYATVSAAFKVMLIESGEIVKRGMVLRSNGTRVPGSIVIGSLRMEIELPSVIDTSWRCIGYRTDGSTYSIAASLTLLANKRNVTSGVLNVTVAASDKILLQQTSGTSGAYMGAGITLVGALGTGATFPTDPTLTAPSTPTASVTASKITVNWGTVANATSYLVYRQLNGVMTPLDEVSSAMTSYDDLNVVTGSSYTYAVAAMAPGIISTLSSTVVASPTTTYNYPQNVSDGAPVAMVVQKGANGTNQDVTVINTSTTPTLKFQSGAAGGNVATDRVAGQFNVDGAKHYLYDISGLYCPGASTSIWDLYLMGTTDSSGSGIISGTNSSFVFYDGFQIEVKPDGVRLALKVLGGTFTTLVDYTLTGLSGGAAVNADGAHWYAFRATVSDPGDGTFALKWWDEVATSIASVRSGATGPRLTASATSTQRSSMTVGGLYIVQLGHTNTGTITPVAQTTQFQDIKVAIG